MFDFLNINLGNILTIVSFLIGGIAFAYTIKGDVKGIGITVDSYGRRLEGIELEMRKISDVLVTLARQDERMNSLDRQILELKAAVALRQPVV